MCVYVRRRTFPATPMLMQGANYVIDDVSAWIPGSECDLLAVLLPRVAMRKRGLCCRPVFVCPSVTLTLGHYNWLELFKKQKCLKKRKQSCFVATIGILFAFHAIFFCLLVVQQGCKYVIIAPLHLKVHAIVFKQMHRLLRSGSMRIVECRLFKLFVVRGWRLA